MHKMFSVLRKVLIWTLRMFLVRPISWFWRKLSWRMRAIVLVVPILFGVFEPFTPAYWLALGVYYESRGEPFRGRYAVANVIFNRVDSRLWPNTVKGVVTDGLERGRSCDFTFMCDGRSENPWLHHPSRWSLWLRSRAEAWVFYTLYSAHILYDNTHGAVYYKRKDTYSPWFAAQIEAGRMTKVCGDFGAHEFFTMGAR